MKKRVRGSYRNPVPFLEDGGGVRRKRVKSEESRQHKEENLIMSLGLSSKILKEAQIQQKEIESEELHRVAIDEEAYEEYDDDDEFGAFVEMYEEDCKVMEGMINEHEEEEKENEKLLDRFLSKEEEDLPDFILEAVKKKDQNVSSADARPLLEMDTHYKEIFKGVAKFMKAYTAGKITKPFKFIPSMQQWEEALKLTEPENWSPHAMYAATRILASNLSAQAAARFYKSVLLPRLRQDIRNNKRLHPSLYLSLKKSVFKRAAFFKGILLPLCQSKTCTLREAFVVGSIITKVRIHQNHAGAALMMLAQMEFSGTTSYFIKLLLEKKLALQYRVIEAFVVHFMRFLEEPRIMPVIWHQSLLAFAQTYKNALQKEDKDKLINLVEAQKHHEVTPEIRRELLHGGEKEDHTLSITPVKEDLFDIPEVPMEDD